MTRIHQIILAELLEPFGVKINYRLTNMLHIYLKCINMCVVLCNLLVGFVVVCGQPINPNVACHIRFCAPVEFSWFRIRHTPKGSQR